MPPGYEKATQEQVLECRRLMRSRLGDDIPERPKARFNTVSQRQAVWDYVEWLEQNLAIKCWQVTDANKDAEKERASAERSWNRWKALYDKITAIDAILHPKPTDATEGTDAPAVEGN
jgi:hypothetical protein